MASGATSKNTEAVMRLWLPVLFFPSCTRVSTWPGPSQSSGTSTSPVAALALLPVYPAAWNLATPVNS